MSDDIPRSRVDVTPENMAADVVPDAVSDVSTPNSIVIVCEEDGRSWADFFKSKLTGHNYSLKTWIQSFSDCDSYLLSETSKLQVVLISPSLLENTTSAQKLLTFSSDSSVFILLGVDENDVRTEFGKDSEDILKFQHHMIEESNTCESLKDALVKIIQCYEYEKDTDDDCIYEVLPVGKPVLVNKLIDVFPSNNLTGGSDIYLLLERKAEETVNIVIDKPGGKTIPAQHTNTAIYRVTLPEETSGYVSFRVESEQKLLGQHDAHGTSKLEQLRSLLLDTTDPLAIMCQSLGIPRTSAALDKKLAEQVKNNWSTHTIPVIMQMFESQDHTDETSTEMWPTVLHFAAEYNLELFCTELLKYPGMVNAATISNVNEQYPCEIAKKNGFTSLSQLLFSTVEKYGRHVDSGVVVDPPQPCPGPQYMNFLSSVQTDGSYMTMDNLDTSVISFHFNPDGNIDGREVRIAQKPIPSVRKSLQADAGLQHSASHSRSASPHLHFENSDSSDDYDVVPMQSKTKQHLSPDDTDWSEKPESLKEFISKISPKPSGTKLKDTRGKKHHVSDLGDLRHLPPPPELDESSSVTTPPVVKPRSCSLGTEQTMVPLKKIQQQDIRCSGVYEPVFDEEIEGPVSKQISSPLREMKKPGRFSKFLNKLRRVPTEPEIIIKADPNKKTKVFSRSPGGSDLDLTNYPKRMFKNLSKSVNAERKYSDTVAHPIELERDSGSYSDDDDKETSSATPSPCYHRKKQTGKSTSIFKSPSALMRKKSVRVVKALAEKMDNAPTLPSRSEKDED